MNIALLGYGQMGQMIESIASRHDAHILGKYWDENPLLVNDEIKKELEPVSVIIDFTMPDIVLDNIKKVAELGKNLVMGTTGWDQHINEIKSIVEYNQIGMVYAANFSLGVNLFYRIARYAGQLMSSFEQYDAYVHESHHQFKKDAPSGTGIVIKDILEECYRDKKIPVTSVRAGYIPGQHQIGFDSKMDSIHLEHTARTREGFAAGALVAAQWIENKKGLYSFDTVLDDMLNKTG